MIANSPREIACVISRGEKPLFVALEVVKNEKTIAQIAIND